MKGVQVSFSYSIKLLCADKVGIFHGKKISHLASCFRQHIIGMVAIKTVYILGHNPHRMHRMCFGSAGSQGKNGPDMSITKQYGQQ